LRKTKYGGKDRTELGSMYELCRDEDDHINVKITRPFEVGTIRVGEEWSMVDFQYVGGTQMMHDQIKFEGNSP
jgi:hypothetical protein